MLQPTAATTDSVRQYLREIGRYPLLTHEQEIQYGHQVQRMVQLEVQRQDLATRRGCAVSDAELAVAAELELSQLKALLRSGERAKRRLIESNLRLVVSIAKKYQRLNIEFLDLLQEGGIGLQRAVEKFDPTKGYRFSTYSYWWIRQAMTRVISEHSRTIRLPVHLTEKLVKMKKAQRELMAQLGRRATIEELANHLNMKPQQVKDYLLQSRQPISLDVKLGDENKTALGELLEDPTAAPLKYVALDCLKTDIQDWIVKLTPPQQRILRMRYGLDDQSPMTLQQISEQMGVTRERVRQIEKAALEQLRRKQEIQAGYAYLADVS
jgi:RNA polymerase nonessential primary-like sigma factor